MIQSQTHDCREELREASLKATPARVAIMRLLETVEKPVDIQTLIVFLDKEGINADPATVFRIMNTFTEKGLAKQINLSEGKSRYELASTADHHHLVCTNCGDIQDISDCNIGALEKEIEKKKSFQVTSHALEFFGICAQCQKGNRK